MATYPRTAHEIAAMLTDWMVENDWPMSRPDWTQEKADEHFGTNIWGDVILGSGWYYEEATDKADPNYHNDVVVTTSGEVGMILVGLQRYAIYCEDRAREYGSGHGISWAYQANMLYDLSRQISSADTLTITSNRKAQR